ncbi:unnamed protein product, partial [Durusdinium trenchii]
VAISWRWLRKNGCCINQDDEIGKPPTRFSDSSQGLSSKSVGVRGLKPVSSATRVHLPLPETPRGDSKKNASGRPLNRKSKSAGNLSQMSGGESVQSGRLYRPTPTTNFQSDS